MRGGFGFVAMLLCAAACDNRETLPIEYTTEHLRIGLESDQAFCRADLDALERIVGKVEDELGVTMPDVATLYLWDDALWLDGPEQNCTNPGVQLGCYDPSNSTIWATRSAIGHELVHAVVGSSEAAPMFEEGIADVYGGDPTRFGLTAPTDNVEASGRTRDPRTSRHFVRWLRERWGPASLGRLLAGGKHSVDEFARIYGLSLAAAEALYFDEAPFGYPSLYGCDGPELIAAPGPSWIGVFELDCESGVDTHGLAEGIATHRRFIVDQPGHYVFDADADFFILSRCSPARIEASADPGDELADAPVQHASYPSEASAYYEGRLHTLYLEAGTHEIAVGVFDRDRDVEVEVGVAIWPALIQPSDG